MILITGAKGQLGGDVARELKKRNIPYTATDVSELDITKKEETEKFFSDNNIDTIIHCAAYTAVDKAEEDRENCYKVNVIGTKNLAEEAKKYGCKMIYVSTDYVFSGEGDIAFEVNDRKNPKNYYGETKLLGEEEVKKNTDKYFIVRTSWVFGEKNTNFVYTMLRLSKANSEVRVVADQIGSPTYAKDLALLLCDMSETEKYGEYHARNEGYCSWADFAKKTFEIKNLSTKVIPVKSEEYPTKAKRSKNSRLSLSSLKENGFKILRPWEDALREYLSNI